MKNKIFAWIGGITAVLLLLVLTSVTKSPRSSPPITNSSDQINLALREIADHLLRQNQDFSTLIPPIRREAAGSYLITLETQVDYEQLRGIIDRVLDRHGIRSDYRVSLLDSETGELALGFLAQTEDINKAVPCQDRVQSTERFNIRLALIDTPGPVAQVPSEPTAPAIQWLLLSLAIGIPVV